jgi:hypothetical protein
LSIAFSILNLFCPLFILQQLDKMDEDTCFY